VRRLGEDPGVKRFLDLADFDRAEILDLLALAQSLAEHPPGPVLTGKVLGLVFLNPSLRTLASFQTAMGRLGGTSFVITPGQGTWQLETRPNAVMDGTAAEHIREGIPVLASYCDALGVRAFAEGKNLREDLDERVFRAVDALCEAPLINLESAMNHPCQALADWRTLDELEVPQDGKFVLSWSYHPRALPLAVPSAVVHMAALRGMEVVVARPEGFALPTAVMEKALAAARTAGGSVTETADRGAALEGAHVVYAKEWGSTAHYGDAQADARLRADLKDWCVREDWFAKAAPRARLMHCLPVRRNVAVADEVLDGPRSTVLREARNRLTVQTAVLYRMLAGSL
jgi:N-acetylornithine carbamoyltransferase